MRLALSFIVVLSACHHDPATPPPAPVAPAAAPAAPAAAMDTTQGLPGSQDLAPLANLGVRMHGEAAHRPPVKVTAEHLFESLPAHGVELARTTQVLAATAAASYCALGVTRESVAVAVCEYPSDDDARAGQRLLDSRYRKLVPDAVRKRNGRTLVTVANGTSHPEVRDRVFETFFSL